MNKNTCTQSVHAHQSDGAHQTHLAHVLTLLNTGERPFKKMSWRAIAKFFTRHYGVEFSHATLRRYAKGDPVVSAQHRLVLGWPAYVKAPACPTCGGVCTYDCGTQRAVAKPGTGKRKTSARATIYRGTPLADIISKLAALGHHVAPVEGEIEY